MPGPNSTPKAAVGNMVVEGKTALKQRGLKSGQGFEYQSKAEGTPKGGKSK